MRPDFVLGKLSRLAVIIAVLGGLLLAGGGTASAGTNDPPVNVTAQAYSPGVVLVSWQYGGDVGDLSTPAFTVSNLTTGESYPVNATSATVSGLQPSTSYQFRVCANYPTGPVCADPVSVTTQGAQASTGSGPLPPIITGNDSGFDRNGNPYIGLFWETADNSSQYDYDFYEIHYEVMLASGQWQDPGYPVRAPDSGTSGYHQVSGLTPGTTYLFEIQGCSHVIFGLGGNTCDSSSSPYPATAPSHTIPATTSGISRPTPAITTTESGTTWVAISWSTTPSYPYGKYVVEYSTLTGPATYVDVGGDEFNWTVTGLTPSTTYGFRVQGCESTATYMANGQPSAGSNCGDQSPIDVATTMAPLDTGGGTLVPPSITLSAPTIAAGNSVTVTGSVFPPNDGTVSLGYSYSMSNPSGGESGGSGTLGTATISGQGTFSTTVTLPSSIPPASVTISAQSKTAHATATLQVIAPSSQGTLTITDPTSGLVYTGVNFDYAFTLNGTNFTPGPATIFLDSATGTQVGTATIGADGTFKQNITIATGQTSTGKHTLVVVQNGTVQASLPMTIETLEDVH